MNGVKLAKFIIIVIVFVLNFQVSADEMLGNGKLAKPEKEQTIKLQTLPTGIQDQESQKVLLNLIEKAGWFPNLKVNVDKGLVIIEGKVTDQAQLDWLVRTADRLPSVIAVINKADVDKPADLTPVKNEIRGWITKILRALPGLLAALVLLIGFYFALRVLRNISTKLWSSQIQNPFLLSTIAKLTLVPFYLVMFYIILLTMGLQSLATTIIGGTGVLGLVLGFAFKGIAENYFSGILLAIRSPFTKGDSIQVNDIKGTVQNLNMRGTTIMDPEGTLILIPNSTIVQSVVQNLTVNPQTRTSFIIGIDYNDSIAEAQKIIFAVLENTDRVLKTPAPLVVVDELATSSVNFKVLFWFDANTASLLGMRSRVISACKEALMSGGITLPDGDREIIFKDPLKISSLKNRTEPPREGKKSSGGLDESHAKMSPIQNQEDVKKMASEVSLPGFSGKADFFKK